jgi:hypothetical protein
MTEAEGGWYYVCTGRTGIQTLLLALHHHLTLKISALRHPTGDCAFSRILYPWTRCQDAGDCGWLGHEQECCC